MIRVDRSTRVRPASLDKEYGPTVKAPKIAGKTETAAVIQRILEHREAVTRGDAELEDFKFKYERYSDREVIGALRDLFHGKCAYCESRYAGTQPMDVEHWRPKGEIKDPGLPSIKPGYYWLAAEWTNLLPSCIDCNRGRTQFDMLEQKNIVIGKKNQFPLDDGSPRARRHEDDPENQGGNEMALLINPCLEDPEPFFKYTEDGLILPASDDPNSNEHERAMASIRVYALNRADLVSERKAVVLSFDHRVGLIETLGRTRGSLLGLGLPVEADAIADLIAGEIDVLMGMTTPDRPYAGLARQLIREADPVLAGATP